MDINIKENIIEQIKLNLANKDGITSVKDIDDNRNLHLSFVAFNKVLVEIMLMKAGDMLKIIAAKDFPDKSEKELYEISQMITANRKINFSSDGIQIKLQKTCPFANVEDPEEAKQMCIGAVSEFVDALSENKDKLGDDIETKQKENIDDAPKENKIADEKIKKEESVIESADEIEHPNATTTNEEKDNAELNEKVQQNEAEETTNTKQVAEPNRKNDENIICNNKEAKTSEAKANVKENKKTKKSEPGSDFDIKKIHGTVIEQMNAMAKEMDRVFEQRKKIADYREQTLNKLKESLEAKEKEVRDLIANKDNILKEQENKLKEIKLEIESSQQQLDFNWKAFNDEKEAFNREKEEFEELKKLQESIDSI